MYASDVAGRSLTFAVSGKLWMRSLVMIDDQTQSLWSHLLGEARQGPLEGTKLKVLPSSMTDWKTWRAAHPESTVLNLSRTANNYARRIYQDIGPANFVVGMTQLGVARAWAFDALETARVANDAFAETPLVVFYEPTASTAMIFDRRLGTAGGRLLTFAWKGDRFVDQETGSEWNPQTGTALAGGLKGQRLKPLVGIVSFRNVWEVFHPECEYWDAG